MSGIRIVLAEDAALIGEGLIALLRRANHEVLAWVRDAREISSAVTALEPDLLITDVRMPPGEGDDGLAAAIAVRAHLPGFPVLVLSQYLAGAYARDLLADGEGAVGYLLKERVGDLREFEAAVTAVAAGGTVIDPEVVRTLLGPRGPGPLDRLTEREMQVLGLMAEGKSNGEIAAVLSVSEAAVVKHIGALLAKLDLPPEASGNRRVLAVLAYLDAHSANRGPGAKPRGYFPAV